MKRKVITLLLGLLIQLSLLSTPEKDVPQATQDCYAHILRFLEEVKPVPQTPNWAELLTQKLTISNASKEEATQPEPQFYYSEPLNAMMVTHNASDSILFIINQGQHFEPHLVLLDLSSAKLARSIWETAPHARLKTTEGSTLLPLQTEDFADILVVDAFPFSLEHQAISPFRKTNKPEQVLLLFDKTFFIPIAAHAEAGFKKDSSEQDSGFSATAETIIALRYSTLLYGFSYQVLLESVKSIPPPQYKEVPAFIPVFLAYCKLLSLGCKTNTLSTSTQFNLSADHFFYSALGMIHYDLREKESDSAAALLYWTMIQKNWIKPSLLKRQLDFDLAMICKKLPEYLAQLENLFLSGVPYELPAKYSYRSIQDILEATSW